MALYGTGFNLAAAPIFDKYKYPQIVQAAVTDKQDELIAKYPNIFFYNGSSTAYASTVAGALVKLKNAGQIGNRLAIAHIADTFGIEMKNIGGEILKKAGFEIAYETSYPFTAQDFSPIIKGAKAVNPDAFLAWSYPPDTFGLAEQAKIEGLNVKVYMSAVGTAFQSFQAKFAGGAENILGLGGVKDTPQVRQYFKDLKAATGVDPDYWGQPVYYSMCQSVQQAMEGVGAVDRAAITDWLKNNTTKTILGEMDIRKQKLAALWILGQWQGDFFHAVDGLNVSGGMEMKLKTGWA
jgi:branched-chain amino acid transport system substrate-binding protein